MSAWFVREYTDFTMKPKAAVYEKREGGVWPIAENLTREQAHLIASAPAMLAALKALVDGAHDAAIILSQIEGTEAAGLLASANAAVGVIRKAEGRE